MPRRYVYLYRREYMPQFEVDYLLGSPSGWACTEDTGWVFLDRHFLEAATEFSAFLLRLGHPLDAFVIPGWDHRGNSPIQVLVAGPLTFATWWKLKSPRFGGSKMFGHRLLATWDMPRLEEALGVQFANHPLVPFEAQPQEGEPGMDGLAEGRVQANPILSSSNALEQA
jgi:hypothetical protein